MSRVARMISATGAVRIPYPRLIATLLAVALVGAAVLLGLQAVERHRTTAASASGLAAAGDLVQRLLTYDAGAMEAYRDTADGSTTGTFHDEFTALVRDQVAPNAVEQRASSRAEVVRSAVVDAEPDRVVALLFIDQTTTGDHLSAPRIDAGSARVVVERVDGRWLVAGMEAT